MNIGFGAWRFLLAFLVVISHLWSGMIHGPAAYAVWGFFVLSGFLMTYVLRNKYGASAVGLRDFAYNRFLRIFPAYWVACVLGAVAIMVLPRFDVSVASLNPQFSWPKGWVEWLGNSLLVPLPISNLLVPVSGALAVEVGAYVLMPLMAFSRPAAWLGLILSLLLNGAYGISPESFAVRYSSFLTAFWVFAFGALIAHYQAVLSCFSRPLVSVGMWLLHALVWLGYDAWPWTYGLYFSVFLSGWVVLSLASRKVGRADILLGNLSYPLYLFHTTVAVFMWSFLPPERSFVFFLVSLVFTLLLSWLVVVCIDEKIDGLKRRKAFKRPASSP